MEEKKSGNFFGFTFRYEKLDTMSKKQTPSDFLKLIIGRPVMVKLNSGVDYRGWWLFAFNELYLYHLLTNIITMKYL